MMWLRKKVEALLTYEGVKEHRTQGGRVYTAYLGRQPRFIGIMMAEHPRWFLAMLAATSASLVASLSGNADLFARLGGAVILVGVLFGSFCVSDVSQALESKIDEKLLNTAAIVADAIAKDRIDDPSRLVAGTVPLHLSSQFVGISRDLRKQANEKIRFYRRTEVVFATAGTLQWAFGDMLVCTLSSYWSGSQC